MSIATDEARAPQPGSVRMREIETAYDLDRPSPSIATPSCCCCCCCVTALTVVPLAAALNTGDHAVAHGRERRRHIVALLTIVSMAAGFGIFISLELNESDSSSLSTRILVAGTVAMLGMSWARGLAGVPVLRSVGWSIAVLAGWTAAIYVNVLLAFYSYFGIMLLELVLAPFWIALLVWRSRWRRSDIRATIRDTELATPPGVAP